MVGTEIRRLTKEEMVNLTASALNKIDKFGRIGTGHVTWDETEAMAATIMCLAETNK